MPGHTFLVVTIIASIGRLISPLPSLPCAVTSPPKCMSVRVRCRVTPERKHFGCSSRQFEESPCLNEETLALGKERNGNGDFKPSDNSDVSIAYCSRAMLHIFAAANFGALLVQVTQTCHLSSLVAAGNTRCNGLEKLRLSLLQCFAKLIWGLAFVMKLKNPISKIQNAMQQERNSAKAGDELGRS